MTYLRLAIASLLLVGSQLSFADSIKTYVITQVSMSMSPNDGSGENISFSLTGPGVSITGIAGMVCTGWCDNQPIFGTPVVAPTQIFFSSLDTLVIGGVNQEPSLFSFSGDGLFDQNGGVSRFVNAFAGEGDTFFQFNLIQPQNGKWNATYDYIPPSGDTPGYYLFRHATFYAATPEPGTLALTVTGLAGIAGLVRKKHFAFLRPANFLPPSGIVSTCHRAHPHK
ncbi:MAG TPA: PEP-CTERM sorting domain-containing protein [Terriglobales bacterium]|nr:PEP-CTERM sorting domain-containing protein [Terriglobales bacterium]